MKIKYLGKGKGDKRPVRVKDHDKNEYIYFEPGQTRIVANHLGKSLALQDYFMEVKK